MRKLLALFVKTGSPRWEPMLWRAETLAHWSPAVKRPLTKGETGVRQRKRGRRVAAQRLWVMEDGGEGAVRCHTRRDGRMQSGSGHVDVSGSWGQHGAGVGQALAMVPENALQSQPDGACIIPGKGQRQMQGRARVPNVQFYAPAVRRCHRSWLGGNTQAMPQPRTARRNDKAGTCCPHRRRPQAPTRLGGAGRASAKGRQSTTGGSSAARPRSFPAVDGHDIGDLGCAEAGLATALVAGAPAFEWG
jgi:hypothetical protein